MTTIKPEMLAIIKNILSVNPNCALIGGNSLLLHKKNIRREPKDIDIYCPDGIFKLIPGMGMPKKESAETKEEYDEEQDGQSVDQRITYHIDKIKVDVFTPTNKDEERKVIKIDGLKVGTVEDTMKAKIRYFNAGSKKGKSRYKHRLDIMYYLMMN